MKDKDNQIFTEVTYEFKGKPEKKVWHRYIYDPKEGTYFTRTPKSWGELTIRID